MFPGLFYGGGAAAWDPSSPGDLIAWWDASVAVIQSGGVVSAWDDRSGHLNRWDNSNPSTRPGYSATAWNSAKPGITFTSTKWLQQVSSGLTAYPNGTNKPLTIFATLNITGGAERSLLYWYDLPSVATVYGFESDASNHLKGFNGTGVAGSATVTGGNKRIAIFCAGDGKLSTYIDGVIDINAASFSATLGGLNTMLLGLHPLGTAPLVGTIAEIVVYAGLKTVTDESKYRTYSAAKWGG